MQKVDRTFLRARLAELRVMNRDRIREMKSRVFSELLTMTPVGGKKTIRGKSVYRIGNSYWRVGDMMSDNLEISAACNLIVEQGRD